MKSYQSTYSPHILIYLEVGEKRVRLSDILHNTATMYENAEFARGTKATIIFSIDGEVEREEIVLDKGVAKESTLISFLYLNKDPKPSFAVQ